MIELQFALKLIHVFGAAVLFGTGLGIAFFMWMAHRSRDALMVAHTARLVVIADLLFTANAVIAQPVSGGAARLDDGISGLGALDRRVARALRSGRTVLAAGARHPARVARPGQRGRASATRRCPARYDRLFRIWFLLGWPAFLGTIGIFALMIFKPRLW